MISRVIKQSSTLFYLLQVALGEIGKLCYSSGTFSVNFFIHRILFPKTQLFRGLKKKLQKEANALLLLLFRNICSSFEGILRETTKPVGKYFPPGTFV